MDDLDDDLRDVPTHGWALCWIQSVAVYPTVHTEDSEQLAADTWVQTHAALRLCALRGIVGPQAEAIAWELGDDPGECGLLGVARAAVHGRARSAAA